MLAFTDEFTRKDLTMERILIQVEHLQKTYDTYSPNKKTRDSVTAVNDVSFTIQKGSIMGLIGESGCGKSTVGKTMLNLVPANGGRVCFNGIELFDVENKRKLPQKQLQHLRKDMQIVFQDPYSALDPKRKILDTVTEGAIKHGLCSKKNARDYALRYLNACGIDSNSLLRYPHEFSGGQRQRINIARSLALEPEFLICDEVTAALDVSVQSQILNLLLDLREKYGLTILVISHNIDVVHHLCDNVAVMYLGRIVEMADAKELYNSPAHPYTKLLLSSILIREPEERNRNREFINGSLEFKKSITGCPFHSRCDQCNEFCVHSIPALAEVSPSHFSACWNK